MKIKERKKNYRWERQPEGVAQSQEADGSDWKVELGAEYPCIASGGARTVAWTPPNRVLSDPIQVQ
uniref:Uncharacterized protein n=1 Tax=Oryza rufipogon TaxID=4529 RepID=A0A0E0N3G1_ORYRU